MGQHTGIAWTDSTVNFWWGCSKVGPPCDHCYAESTDKRAGGAHWGPGAPRRKIEGAANLVRSLNRQHDKFFAENGRRRRVFMHSMSDLFDNEADNQWRQEAFSEAEAATNLDFQFCTKRFVNIPDMVPARWRGNWPRHIGCLFTAGDQRDADRDTPRAIAIKTEFDIPWLGISYEPALGAIDVRKYMHGLDWIIVGAESGAGYRPMDLEWARSVVRQCKEFGVAVFVKQLTGKGGRAIKDIEQFPADLQVREFPT